MMPSTAHRSSSPLGTDDDFTSAFMARKSSVVQLDIAGGISDILDDDQQVHGKQMRASRVNDSSKIISSGESFTNMFGSGKNQFSASSKFGSTDPRKRNTFGPGTGKRGIGFIKSPSGISEKKSSKISTPGNSYNHGSSKLPKVSEIFSEDKYYSGDDEDGKNQDHD